MATDTLPQIPACLHIPPLSEGETFALSWAEIEGAARYELDCIFDGHFARETGGSWGDLHDREEACGQSAWQDIAESPARGSPWHGINARGLSWAEHQSKELDWRAFHSQLPDYTVYMGKGTPSDSVGQKDAGLWENLNARSLEWSELREKSPTWQDLPQSAADDRSHRSAMVRIPAGRKTASFRVRQTANDGQKSPYIVSAQLRVTPRFDREDRLQISVVEGQEYLIQIHTRETGKLSGITQTLEYSPRYLQMSECLPHLSHGIHLGGAGTAALEQVHIKNGRIKFRWPEAADCAKNPCRPVLVFRATARRTGSTQIRMH